jgi:hypothetical protein
MRSPPDVEHKSALTDHVMRENHIINWNSAKMIKREGDWLKRGIWEAINIRQYDNFNRDEGRYKLSRAYDSLLRGRQHYRAAERRGAPHDSS